MRITPCRAPPRPVPRTRPCRLCCTPSMVSRPDKIKWCTVSVSPTGVGAKADAGPSIDASDAGGGGERVRAAAGDAGDPGVAVGLACGRKGGGEEGMTGGGATEVVGGPGATGRSGRKNMTWVRWAVKSVTKKATDCWGEGGGGERGQAHAPEGEGEKGNIESGQNSSEKTLVILTCRTSSLQSEVGCCSEEEGQKWTKRKGLPLITSPAPSLSQPAYPASVAEASGCMRTALTVASSTCILPFPPAPCPPSLPPTHSAATGLSLRGDLSPHSRPSPGRGQRRVVPRHSRPK